MHRKSGIKVSVLATLALLAFASGPQAAPSLHLVNDFDGIRLDGINPEISFYYGPTYRGYLSMTEYNMSLYNRLNGSIVLGTNNQLSVIVRGNGDVGIGTGLPDTKLHVAEGGTLPNASFNANSIAGFEKASGNGYVSIMTSSASERGVLFADEISNVAGGIIYNAGSNLDGMQFRANGNVTRMTIDAQGDVGIGKSTPIRPLHVKSRNGSDEYGIMLERSGSTVNWEMSVFQGNFNFFYNGAQAPTAMINTSGVFSASDRRLKKDIHPYRDVLPALDQLQVDSFRMAGGPEEHGPSLGLVAQDVQAVFPEIVSEVLQRDGQKYLYVDYTKTGVLAIKAVQELQRKLEQKVATNGELAHQVADLQDRNRDLEAKNAELEERLALVETLVTQLLPQTARNQSLQ